MPIDMQRAPKIPVGRKASAAFTRLEVEPADDGSFVVTCFYKDADKPSKHTFSNVAAMADFISAKAQGNTKASGAALGAVEKAMEPTVKKSVAIRAESKRAPTRPAGEMGAPAYAETQTDVGY